MSREKSHSVPPRASATTVATSFADFTARARMASSTAMEPPARNPSLEGGCPAARWDTGSGVDMLKSPRSNASNKR